MLCAGFTLVETVKRVKNYKGTALGKGDKVVAIMQVKSRIHYKHCVPTLHSKPRMVQNLSQCWSIHRYKIQQRADQVLALC